MVFALTMAVIAGVRGCSDVGSGLGGSADGQPPGTATGLPKSIVAAEVDRWWAGGVQSDILAITNDAGLIRADPTDSASAKKADFAMQLDITTAKDYPPIPDDQAEQLWLQTLDMYSQASSDRMDAANTGSAETAREATQEVQAAAAQYDRLSARFNDLHPGTGSAAATEPAQE